MCRNICVEFIVSAQWIALYKGSAPPLTILIILKGIKVASHLQILFNWILGSSQVFGLLR